MILFIIGCVLAGLVIISIPLLCVLLLVNEKKIKKLGWWFYAIMFGLIALGIVAIGLIFGGHAMM